LPQQLQLAGTLQPRVTSSLHIDYFTWLGVCAGLLQLNYTMYHNLHHVRVNLRVPQNDAVHDEYAGGKYIVNKHHVVEGAYGRTFQQHCRPTFASCSAVNPRLTEAGKADCMAASSRWCLLISACTSERLSSSLLA